MRSAITRFTCGVSTAAMAACIGSAAFAADVTKQRLENADGDPNNWITWCQNYSSHRYSELAKINRNNVGNLKVAFSMPLTNALDNIPNNTANLEMTPLVDDGFLYLNSAYGLHYKIEVNRGNTARSFGAPKLRSTRRPRSATTCAARHTGPTTSTPTSWTAASLR